jgi:putative membrane protein
MDLILHFLLLGAVIFLLAELLPGLHVESYGIALVVAIVYGIINVTLGTVLMIISFPFMIITVGLFKLIINTFLLWVTDQLIDDFEIKDLGTTFVAAVVITVSDSILSWIF